MCGREINSENRAIGKRDTYKKGWSGREEKPARPYWPELK